jgi:hypothetical protein
LWDSKLVDFSKYSYTEYADVLDKKSKDEVAKIQSGNLEDWLFESYNTAAKIYSQTQLMEIIVTIITINFLELWKTNFERRS